MIVLIAVLIALLPQGCDMLVQFDRGLHSRLQILENGAPKSEIFALLGEPITSDAECCLPQQMASMMNSLGPGNRTLLNISFGVME